MHIFDLLIALAPHRRNYIFKLQRCSRTSPFFRWKIWFVMTKSLCRSARVRPQETHTHSLPLYRNLNLLHAAFYHLSFSFVRSFTDSTVSTHTHSQHTIFLPFGKSCKANRAWTAEYTSISNLHLNVRVRIIIIYISKLLIKWCTRCQQHTNPPL